MEQKEIAYCGVLIRKESNIGLSLPRGLIGTICCSYSQLLALKTLTFPTPYPLGHIINFKLSSSHFVVGYEFCLVDCNLLSFAIDCLVSVIFLKTIFKEVASAAIITNAQSNIPMAASAITAVFLSHKPNHLSLMCATKTISKICVTFV